MFTLQPIGIVENEVTETPHYGFNWKAVTSRIVIDKRFTEALDGLDEFSHIAVLFWAHKAKRDNLTLKIHPRGKEELPLMGLFATRTPNRPNPILMSTVKLLERRGNVLYVSGLDAINDTPVIDIKPHIPGDDMPADVKVPPWLKH